MSTLHPETENVNDFPPPRNGAGELKSVPAPLTHTRLSRVIYVLVILTAMLAAYYGVLIVQLKTKDWGQTLGWRSSLDVRGDGGGGLWGRWADADGGEMTRSTDLEHHDVGSRVRELAGVLDVPVADLAAAVAGVVASVHARETE